MHPASHTPKATTKQPTTAKQPTPRRLTLALLAFLTIIALLPILAVNANAEDNNDSDGNTSSNGTAGGDSKVAVVLDASDSMAEKDTGDGGTRMDAAKKAANETINTLADSAQTAVIAYGSEESNAPDNREKGCQDITTLASLGNNKPEDLEDKINELEPKGYTPIGNAIKQAAEELGDNGTRNIILVSDGIDTCAPPPVCDVAEDIAGDGIDLAIHTVGFKVDDKAQKELECISDVSGGTYTSADDTEALTEALTDAAQRVAGNYESAGTPVQLADNATDGFYLGEGLYQSTLPSPKGSNNDGDDKWFSISVPEGKKAQVTANLVPVGFEGGDHIYYNINVEYKNDSCSDKGSGYFGSSNWPGPPEAESVTIDPEEDCDPTKYRVKLNHSGTELDRDLPVEIMVGFAPQVDGSDAGPENDRETPEGKDKDKVKVPSTTPKPTPGGNSYNNATEITPGTVSDTLVPGETKFYRMNVDWGQRPIAEVEFDKKNTDDSRNGDIYVASPRREVTSEETTQTLDKDVPTTARAVGTPYVFYRNREENVAHQEASDAGQWYVMVTLEGYKDNGKQAKDIEFRLSTAVEGNKVDGPEWRQTLEPGPEPTPEPPGTNDDGNDGQENNGNSSDESDAQAKDIDNASQSNTILYIGLGVLVLILLAAVAVYFTAVRRK
ncbi:MULTISPECIES: VWA domain-containing protein [unclassified Corynebacterium]|uniref:vWA domain-containing protein n=1 Tax=unclassified Corynebacterium TaxID=2624378 RepID=UPI001EF44A6A|nr:MULTISPECIES: VWA domain-containing protein [unclassified Corynebacterium]MCG7258125.1 VWA domain-containing protein [Corynebacterium sp. ACRQK]MCG7262558.1 VWA domain-containing protein [Corynebacterium sp. ACRQL]